MPSQMIESAAQIVNSIADEQWPMVFDLYDALNAINDRPILTVVLSPERDRFWITGSGFENLGPKLVDVHHRPFLLRPATGEVEDIGHAG